MRVPDLIRTSGRENMPSRERVELLRGELAQLDLYRPITGADIHDYVGLLTGAISMFLTLCDRDPLSPSCHLSDMECRVLAWRRGGIGELRAVVRGQRDR